MSTHERLAQVEAQIIAHLEQIDSMVTREQILAHRRETIALIKELKSLRSKISRGRT